LFGATPQYFPPEATFEFVWPTGPIAGLEPAEWFMNLVEQNCLELGQTQQI
jgi:hypothetical protein